MPAGFMEQIVEYRRYAEMKRAHDAATTADARRILRGMPFGELVEVITSELVQEEIDEQTHG